MKEKLGLLRWNQFILGSAVVDSLPDWQKVRIGQSWWLTAHPSLNVCQLSQGEQSITLLGFILDPESPHANDSEILSGLLEQIETFSRLVERTSRLGGRWVLILCDGKAGKLLHDACGLRQVYYSDHRSQSGVWCASQPELIGDLLGLPVNREANAFFRLQMARFDRECWWPGDSSPYNNIHHLLPNHYLDLATALPCRYWPQHHLQTVSLSEGVSVVGQLLIGMMKAASHRFDLSLGLTAGYDSRCVLAASREIADRIAFHTVDYMGTAPSNSADIAVASSLLRKLGLKHELVQMDTTIDEEYFAQYRQSVKHPHEYWYPGVQATFRSYKLEKVGVSGSCAEIGRCFYGAGASLVGRTNIAGKSLASVTGMDWHPFPSRYFQEWFDRLGDTKGFSVFDVFYWEQRVGNWLAMCQGEWDIAWRDIFTPFNCRDLLTHMLGVKEDCRCNPAHSFHRKLISSLWPDALLEPVNPHLPSRFEKWVRSRLSPVSRLIRPRRFG